MKKVALSLLALAVVGVSAFAEAPKWDPKVSTDFKGEASVTLGYDLDTNIAAFKNGTSVSLIVDLVTGGDRVSASDKDVWGEIRIKTDGDPYRIKADGVATDGKATFEPGFKLQVDYAKIHFGKAAYLSVTSKDTKIGYVNSPDLAFVGHWFDSWKWADTPAVAASSSVIIATGTETATTGVTYTTLSGVAQSLPLTAGVTYIKNVAKADAVTLGTGTATRYGADNGAIFAGGLGKTIDSVGAASAGGFELGYSLEKVASLAVTVGTVDAWSTDLVNARTYTQIAYKVTAGLLAVDNLTLEGGYSGQTGADTVKVVGAKAAYKYQIDGDKLYVKPLVGYAMITPAGKDAKAYNTAVASLLLGTGPKAAQFDNYGLKLDNDYGAYPGVSVGVNYNDYNVVNSLKYSDGTAKKAGLGLNVSANSGALIADTTVVAAYDVWDLNAKDVASAITLGAATSLPVGDVKIAPKGFLVSESSKGTFAYYKSKVLAYADSALFAKATVDVTGVIPFVTFTVNYESNDLTNGFGVQNDKLGKTEFTTKIAF